MVLIPVAFSMQRFDCDHRNLQEQRSFYNIRIIYRQQSPNDDDQRSRCPVEARRP